MPKAREKTIAVEALTHKEAKCRNIPTAEFESLMRDQEKSPVRIAYERRNRDLDPQLVWRGKDEQDWSDLVVQAPPVYIQEKVHPKVLIDDLSRQSTARAEQKTPPMPDLFAASTPNPPQDPPRMNPLPSRRLARPVIARSDARAARGATWRSPSRLTSAAPAPDPQSSSGVPNRPSAPALRIKAAPRAASRPGFRDKSARARLQARGLIR